MKETRASRTRNVFTESVKDFESMGGVKRHRKNIVDMINQIDNENYLLKIYSFVKVFFEN